MPAELSPPSLWIIRHHLSLSPLPCPTPPTPTSPTASVSPHLSVPSHFRSIRRPSRSMRPGRGFTGTRDSFGKGSSQSLPGSWGQGNHQHPPQRSQPGPHQPARRQKDRGYSQWTPIVGGSATRGRHHPGISFDFLQPAPKTCRPIRRSSAPGRTQIQGAHIPRTSPFQEVQARGPRHRNRGPVEPGSNNFPPPVGPDKSQGSPQHPSQSCCGFPPLTLVSHPHPCSPTCLRGQSPGLRLRRHQQYWWGHPLHQPASVRSAPPTPA